MITGPIVAQIAGALTTTVSAGARFFGFSGLSTSQEVTYQELMNLSDRQLEDIGLTRGLIETVVVQGPEALKQFRTPEDAAHAVSRPANVNRLV
ncbi:DUF1127 domain-containing protein [Fodinicurvata sp. EGI_FJ10296]|uniref:DUF1127 domain-containing protein n=1 Tax=Fodinicurvata sp. EGI_FJ10296 TaxID=3231908 RepID=UPI003452591C